MKEMILLCVAWSALSFSLLMNNQLRAILLVGRAPTCTLAPQDELAYDRGPAGR